MKVAIAPIVLSTASLGLIFGVAQNAQAALITGVTASTDMGVINPADVNIADTVNGRGLPSNTPSLTGSHAVATSTNAWSGTATTGNITFNLNGSYSLAGFSFWNFNAVNTAGIKDVTVQSSSDGTTFTTVAGAPTQFAIASNAPIPPAVYSFSPVTASYVRFVVASNWGWAGSNAGFSEVQFDGTPIPVPEPSSLLALLTFGLAGVGFRKLM